MPTITDPIVRCSEDILTHVPTDGIHVTTREDMCLTPLLPDGTCPRQDIHDSNVVTLWRCSECGTYVTDVTARHLPDGRARDLCVGCASDLGLARSGARRRTR